MNPDNSLLVKDLKFLVEYEGDDLEWQITKILELAESGYYHLGRKEVIINGNKQD